MQVGGEHLAVALAQRVTEDVAGVGDELARGPRVAVLVAVEVVDEDLEQLRADRPDRAKLINGGERDDAGADELACLLGQLEQLDARRDPGLRPAERLRGPVFGQALVEHRLDRCGLLGRAELEASDVLDRPVSLFAGAVADHGRDLDEPELVGRGDAVEAGHELVLEAGVGGDVVLCGADDDRDEHPLQRDRRRERVDVLGVERAHVLRDVDPRERQRESAGGGGCGSGHQASP